MPSIVMPRSTAKDATAKDPSLRSKMGAFLSKLTKSDATKGLHIEPIRGTSDPRVRTARVDAFYRAVLFQIGQGEEAVYVIHGVWPHDDAIEEAKRVTLKVNPRNGATEVTQVAQAMVNSQAQVEEAQRRAQDRLAAAEREAREIAEQAARLEQANAQARRGIAHQETAHGQTAPRGVGEASTGQPQQERAEAAQTDPGRTDPAGTGPGRSGAMPTDPGYAGQTGRTGGSATDRSPSHLAAGVPAPRAGSPEAWQQSVVVPSDLPPRWPQGLSVEALRDELGIDVGLAAAALAAQRESQLLDLAATAQVPWHGEALLSLATGSSVEEVRADYGLLVPAEIGNQGQGEDEALLAGLRTRAARSTFTWVDNDEELRQAIENLSFQQWQLFLHPRQRTLVEWDVAGPIRISGGAGTGKTVVAVHRAAWLACGKHGQHGPGVAGTSSARGTATTLPGMGGPIAGQPRILLTTFTRNLAEDLKRQVSQLDPGLELAAHPGEPGILVSGLDALATGVLQRAGDAIAQTAQDVLGRKRTRVLAQARGEVWRDVLAVTGDGLRPNLYSADFLASEYEMVILPQRIINLQTYLRVRRPGRGVALDRATRATVWKAIEAYRDRAASLDITTFPERLVLAAAWLDRQAAEGQGRLFDHVIVDEAQDLSPAHLQLLRALVEAGRNDIFLAEDSHQRIYGKKITLSHYGIQVRGRSRRMTRNYRTTRQNLNLAFGILEPGSYEDMEGVAEEHRYVSPRSGPEPVLVHAQSRAAELDAAAELMRRWRTEDEGMADAAPETIAVLVRDRYHRDVVVTGLAERGVEVRPVDREAVGRGRPVVMTMHRAKGLEFRKVLLFDVSAASIPRSLRDQEYSKEDWADAMLRERSLLYVAATRARDQLAISWSGQVSPLLEELAPQAT